MNQAFYRDHFRRGFSLLELLAVVTILGILVSIVLTRITDTTESAKEKTCLNNVSQINSALERFAVSTGGFATTMADGDTIDYFPGGIPTCEVDDSTYSLNTTTHRVDRHTH